MDLIEDDRKITIFQHQATFPAVAILVKDKNDSNYLWNEAEGYFGTRKDSKILLSMEEAKELYPQRDIPVPKRKWTVYAHFRNLGWIVRDGLGYGADYLLYSKPPGQVHSHYAVIISDKKATWRSLAGTSRAVYGAKKELLIVVLSMNDDSIEQIVKMNRFIPSDKYN